LVRVVASVREVERLQIRTLSDRAVLWRVAGEDLQIRDHLSRIRATAQRYDEPFELGLQTAVAIVLVTETQQPRGLVRVSRLRGDASEHERREKLCRETVSVVEEVPDVHEGSMRARTRGRKSLVASSRSRSRRPPSAFRAMDPSAIAGDCP
jgi:hypothetical protein